MKLKGLTKQFVVDRNWLGRPKKLLTAVNGVSLTIEPGETVGLVGESGCGKSTFARTLLGLYPKTAGSIFYKDRNIDDPGVGQAYRRQVQIDLSGSLCLFGPADDCRRYHQRASSQLRTLL